MDRLGDQILIGARDFSLLQNVQTDSGVHPASYSAGAGDKAAEA
jgi:hypothetical protein